MKPPADWPALWRDSWVDIDEFTGDEMADLARQMYLGQLSGLQDDIARLDLTKRRVVLGYHLADDTSSVGFTSMSSGTVTAISIPSSAALQLMLVFNCLVSGTRALERFGLGSDVTIPFALDRLYATEPYVRSLVAGRPFNVDEVEQSDEVRACWSFLVQSTLRFMYLHELGHLISGHGSGAVRGGSADRWVREVQADWTASLAAAKLLTEEVPADPVGRDPFFLWGFAVGTLFNLIEAISQDNQAKTAPADRFSPADGGGGYPRGGFRGYVCSSVLDIIYPDKTGTEWETVRATVAGLADGYAASNAAWQEIGWGTVEQATDPELRMLVTRLEENPDAWNPGRAEG